MKCSLVSPILLKISLVFPFCCFPLYHWGRLSYLSLLFFGSLHSDGYVFPLELCIQMRRFFLHHSKQLLILIIYGDWEKYICLLKSCILSTRSCDNFLGKYYIWYSSCDYDNHFLCLFWSTVVHHDPCSFCCSQVGKLNEDIPSSFKSLIVMLISEIPSET